METFFLCHGYMSLSVIQGYGFREPLFKCSIHFALKTNQITTVSLLWWLKHNPRGQFKRPLSDAVVWWFLSFFQNSMWYFALDSLFLNFWFSSCSGAVVPSGRRPTGTSVAERRCCGLFGGHGWMYHDDYTEWGVAIWWQRLRIGCQRLWDQWWFVV